MHNFFFCTTNQLWYWVARHMEEGRRIHPLFLSHNYNKIEKWKEQRWQSTSDKSIKNAMDHLRSILIHYKDIMILNPKGIIGCRVMVPLAIRNVGPLNHERYRYLKNSTTTSVSVKIYTQ